MAFKDILIHVDSSPACAARLDLAISFARKNHAFLTGLFVIPHKHYSPLHRADEQRATESESAFRQKTSLAGIDANWLCVDWSVTGVGMNEIIDQYAYHKDLVIVGQTDHSFQEEDIPHDLPERVVIGSGRPVLVVPYAGTFSKIGEKVLVAWQPGRESARALHDAMPLIQEAQQVIIAGVESPKRNNFDVNNLGDIITHLERHKIEVKVTTVAASNIPIGDVLLNTAWEEGCDLIVMGACAHKARGASAFGPVAKHVMTYMPVPVFMSH
jgi:nucleotide-binding universal stress UspA family protein